MIYEIEYYKGTDKNSTKNLVSERILIEAKDPWEAFNILSNVTKEKYFLISFCILKIHNKIILKNNEANI